MGKCFSAVAVEADFSETGRFRHYFHTQISDEFDAVIHFDETHAGEPLERT